GQDRSNRQEARERRGFRQRATRGGGRSGGARHAIRFWPCVSHFLRDQDRGRGGGLPAHPALLRQLEMTLRRYARTCSDLFRASTSIARQTRRGWPGQSPAMTLRPAGGLIGSCQSPLAPETMVQTASKGRISIVWEAIWHRTAHELRVHGALRWWARSRAARPRCSRQFSPAPARSSARVRWTQAIRWAT